MMSMSYRTIVASGLGLAAIVCAAPAMAQTAPTTLRGPLDTYVNANGGTQVQRSIASAVQATCTGLAAQGGLQLADGTSKKDLFLRCNEMVGTANALNGASPARSLGYTKADQLLGSLQQISGEELSAQGSLSTQVSAGQFANISGRLNALRLGGSSTASRGRVAALDQNGNGELLAANPNAGRLGSGASADSQGGLDRKWGWFAETSYGFGDHDQTTAEDGFDFDSVSVTTGTDYNFGSSVLGFSVGFDRYNADFDKRTLVTGGDVKVEGISGSVFGAYNGDGLSMSGIATYGSLSSDVTRRAVYTSFNNACNPACPSVSRSFTGSPDGSYVALGLTLSKDFTVGGWDLTPSLSGSYRNVDVDGYSEKESVANGGLAIAYNDQTIKSTKSILGIAVSKPFSKSFGVLTPNFRAEWHHEFEDDARTLSAKYAVENTTDLNTATSDCVSCFAFSTDQPESDFGVVGLGLSATFAQRMQGYVYYETLLGAQDLTSNSIAIGIRGSF
jgi:outer membrane lipase/esterase